jgi:predicted porin
MKNILFSAAALTALLTAPLAAANGPIDGKVYGKINVSVVNSDDGTNDSWELKSNASRIGLKGSTEISEGLSVFYKTEFEVAVDDGSNDIKKYSIDTLTKDENDALVENTVEVKDTSTFKQRNIFVGIKGQYGSLLAGKNDTPTKLAQKKIDLFNDLNGDIKNIFKGENRMSNIIAYTTPKYGNFSASYAVMPSEDDNGGLADSKSYSVNYKKDGLYLAVAADSNVKDADILRIVSQYKLDAWKLGLMYQENDTAEKSGYFASAAYKSGNVTYKAQYGVNEADNSNAEDTTLSLGADLKLAKKTKAYVFYTDNDNSKAAESFGIGLEHKF